MVANPKQIKDMLYHTLILGIKEDQKYLIDWGLWMHLNSNLDTLIIDESRLETIIRRGLNTYVPS